MANDSGLSLVTPNSSACSRTAVPVAPAARPSPPVPRPGTRAVSPRPPVQPPVPGWTLGLSHTAPGGLGLQGKPLWGSGTQHPVVPCAGVAEPPAAVCPPAPCVSLLRRLPGCLQLRCPCSLLSLP